MSNSEPQDKVYPAYKVSEFTANQQPGKGYKVDESKGVPARAEPMSELEKRLESVADIDFKKKHSLKNNSEEYRQEYKTTGDAMRELSPFSFKK